MNSYRHLRKTRIAPTPSGFLHLGNAVSFLLTAKLAAETNAKLLLRIDDMDRQRVRQTYIDDIFNTLHFLGINWHEGPANADDFESHFSQKHRLPLYLQALEQLAADDLIFACNCSRSQLLQQNAEGNYTGACLYKNLPLQAPGVCWRLKTDQDTVLNMHSLNGDVISRKLPLHMQFFVVKTREGTPAYQLTSLIDDLYFNIDLLVRGEDLLPSTLAQLYLANRLQRKSFMQTVFVHHSLISDEQGHKLSKSAGANSINYMRRHGMQKADIMNIIEQSLRLVI